MIVTNDAKFPWNNVGSSSFKNNSISSISTVTSKTAAASPTATTPKSIGEPNSGNTEQQRLQSLADEEIIQKNLKELMEKKHQEERKANGRLVAVILACLVIFLAIYHAWIRNSGMLAGVLVPAVIMFSFGAWVVVLAKRDKARRQVFEKYLQEVAEKNKRELAEKKLKKSKVKKSSSNFSLHYENEINSEQIPLTQLSGNSSRETKPSSILKSKDHRKHRKHRNHNNSDNHSTTSSSSSSKKSSHYATKDLRVKRPSIRQKLFRQTGLYHMTVKTTPHVTHTLVEAIINTPVPQGTPPLINGIPVQCNAANSSTLLETKRRRLQRLDSFQVPTMVRMSSAP